MSLRALVALVTAVLLGVAMLAANCYLAAALFLAYVGWTFYRDSLPDQGKRRVFPGRRP